MTFPQTIYMMVIMINCYTFIMENLSVFDRKINIVDYIYIHIYMSIYLIILIENNVLPSPVLSLGCC